MILVRSIMGNSLEHVLGKSSQLGGLIDASPIYADISVRVTLSGGMTSGTNERMTFDVDETFLLERVQIDGSGLDPELEGMEANGDFDIGVINLDSVGEGQFIMKAEKATVAGDGGSRVFSPTNGAFSIYPPAVFRTVNPAGTYQLDPDPAVDLVGELSVAMPDFVPSAVTPSGERGLVDRLRLSFTLATETVPSYTLTADLDISAWTRAKWRDIRGTYTATESAGTYHPVGWDTSDVIGSIEFILS